MCYFKSKCITPTEEGKSSHFQTAYRPCNADGKLGLPDTPSGGALLPTSSVAVTFILTASVTDVTKSREDLTSESRAAATLNVMSASIVENLEAAMPTKSFPVVAAVVSHATDIESSDADPKTIGDAKPCIEGKTWSDTGSGPCSACAAASTCAHGVQAPCNVNTDTLCSVPRFVTQAGGFSSIGVQPHECTDATKAAAAVRCCSKEEGGGKVMMKHYGGVATPCENLTGKTFAEASGHCASYGFRLCTTEELDDNAADGTGCNFGAKRIWSSSSTSSKTGDCNACVEGKTWSKTGSGPCSLCAAASMCAHGVKVPCNVNADTLCNNAPPAKCVEGETWNKAGLEPCSACAPASSCAHGVKTQCVAVADTVCEDPPGPGKITQAGGAFFLGTLTHVCTDSTTETAAVRCCGKDGGKVAMAEYGGTAHPCNNLQGKTFAEASTHCKTFDLRLCTTDEADADKTTGTGCGFDTQRIWTSSTASLKTGPCEGHAVDCSGTWGAWSACDGDAAATRTRSKSFTVTAPAEGAGKACPVSPETEGCGGGGGGGVPTTTTTACGAVLSECTTSRGNFAWTCTEETFPLLPGSPVCH